MEVTILVFSLAAVVAIIYFIRKSTLDFNKKCLINYEFKPINFSRIAIASLPVFIITAGFIFDDRSNSYWNISASIVISIIIMWRLFKHIKIRTTQKVATISLVLLSLYGLCFIVVLFILLSLFISSRNDNRPFIEKMGF
ncbi:MAG: hypothetical protein P8179_13215 [Candidatus Thiodiazotropha sp.]